MAGFKLTTQRHNNIQEEEEVTTDIFPGTRCTDPQFVGGTLGGFLEFPEAFRSHFCSRCLVGPSDRPAGPTMFKLSPARAVPKEG